MPQEEIVLHSAEETRRLGHKLARALRDRGALVFISGDLGAGKTTLVQGMIQELLAQPINVQSPTFAYLHTYAHEPAIHHFDLYRLEDDHEALFDLGLMDAINDEHALRLIEWPERLGTMAPKPDITIDIVRCGPHRKAAIKYFIPF